MGLKFQRILTLFGLSFFSLVLLSSIVLAEETTSRTTTPFAGFGLIITIVMLFQISSSEKTAIKEANNKIIGVAGWLLFFIGLMAITGFIGILRIVSDLAQIIIYDASLLLSFAFVFTELLDLIVATGFVVAAYYLWKVKPGARWLAIGVLLFDLLVIGVNWLVSTDELFLFFSVMGVFWNIIFLLYLFFSKRVKNTYAKKAILPKSKATSNKTVIGWIIYQGIIGLILVSVFQVASWAEIAEYTKELTTEQENLLNEYNAKVGEINIKLTNMESKTRWLASIAESDILYDNLYYQNVGSYNELYHPYNKSANELLDYINNNEKELIELGIDVEQERTALIDMLDFYTEIYETINSEEDNESQDTDVVSNPQEVTRIIPESNTYYTSREPSGKYYCNTDEEWKKIPFEYLIKYGNERDLKKAHPNRVLNKPC